MAKYELIDRTNLGPVTALNIRKPGGEPTDFAVIGGILDTGSPRTHIPKSVVEDLNLSALGCELATGFDGIARIVDAYEVDITMKAPEFDRREFTGMRVLVCGLDKALIGRDILQHFVVTFDGPAQEWRVR